MKKQPNIISVTIYWICAAVWSINVIIELFVDKSGGSRLTIDLIVMAVWLAAAILNTLGYRRYVKKVQNDMKEEQNK